jgi:hypothetical protein
MEYEGTLTASVGSQEGHRLARIQVKIHSGQSLHASITELQVAYFN